MRPNKGETPLEQMKTSSNIHSCSNMQPFNHSWLINLGKLILYKLFTIITLFPSFLDIIFWSDMEEPKRTRPDSLEKEEKQEEQVKEKKEESVKLNPLMLKGNFTVKDIKYEKKLDRKYFRQDVETLSKSLLGKIFVRETSKGVIKAVIVET